MPPKYVIIVMSVLMASTFHLNNAAIIPVEEKDNDLDLDLNDPEADYTSEEMENPENSEVSDDDKDKEVADKIDETTIIYSDEDHDDDIDEKSDEDLKESGDGKIRKDKEDSVEKSDDEDEEKEPQHSGDNDDENSSEEDVKKVHLNNGGKFDFTKITQIIDGDDRKKENSSVSWYETIKNIFKE